MTGSPVITKHHQQFLNALEKSNQDVWLVAMWLQSRGNTVSVNGLHRAPSADQWEGFSDSGDLVIHRRQEVKALSADFTGLDDWPFGREFFIDQREGVDRAKVKPEMYFCLNRAKTHIGVLDVQKTRKSWWVKKTTNKITGKEYEVYCCDPALVLFGPMYESDGGPL